MPGGHGSLEGSDERKPPPLEAAADLHWCIPLKENAEREAWYWCQSVMVWTRSLPYAGVHGLDGGQRLLM